MSARTALISTVVTYNLRLWLAGLSAAMLVPLSAAALVLDLLTGRTEDGLARKVLAASARMEALIDVHGDLTDVRVRGEATPAAAPDAEAEERAPSAPRRVAVPV